ncbi:non-specific serine/threonine protein kinase [Flavobacteriaceae bacterium UJ101]|nr:non-specific serine/threonine protein kinase [Flavobacteriaceae bacterium UJ101]
MKNVVHNIITEFAPVSINETEKLLEKWIARELKQQDNFIEIGQRNNLVGFLKTGLLRSYYYDDNGNEQTTAFIEQGSFFSELKSYQTQEPSERTIEALEPSEIFVLTTNDIKDLRKTIPNWELFEIKYFEKILREKVNFQRELLTKSSKKEALELFIKEYPQSAKYAPRQYIASFLGMSPYTLSRIKL